MVHRRDVSAGLNVQGRTEIVRADLANPASLDPAVDGMDVIVHFAGVLFRSNPAGFLPLTNTGYFRNLGISLIGIVRGGKVKVEFDR
jgi:uncharacterized protein YbjT (DUF2867 family)